MTNIFAAENEYDLIISRTIHMFAKMTNDEKRRFASVITVMPRNHETCSRPETDFSQCARVATSSRHPRENAAAAAIDTAKIERAHAGVRMDRGGAADRGRSTTQGEQRDTGERTDTQSAPSRCTSAMGRRASEVPPHAVKINGTIAIYLVSHDNKR